MNEETFGAEKRKMEKCRKKQIKFKEKIERKCERKMQTKKGGNLFAGK